MKLPNIKHCVDVSKFIQVKDDPYAYIMMHLDREYLEDNKACESFIKECERSIRRSDDYKGFIDWIQRVVGINFCQVSSKIISSDKVHVEMHHGPIFTIYDVILCAIDYRLDKNLRVNTFTITDQVLQDNKD